MLQAVGPRRHGQPNARGQQLIARHIAALHDQPHEVALLGELGHLVIVAGVNLVQRNRRLRRQTVTNTLALGLVAHIQHTGLDRHTPAALPLDLLTGHILGHAQHLGHAVVQNLDVVNQAVNRGILILNVGFHQRAKQRHIGLGHLGAEHKAERIRTQNFANGSG